MEHHFGRWSISDLGYHILYTKSTKLCVDHLTEKDGAEQARRKTAGLAYVRRVIHTAESAVEVV